MNPHPSAETFFPSFGCQKGAFSLRLKIKLLTLDLVPSPFDLEWAPLPIAPIICLLDKLMLLDLTSMIARANFLNKKKNPPTPLMFLAQSL